MGSGAGLLEAIGSENHGVGGSIPPLGTTQATPAKKLRDGRWMGLGAVACPGAAQGPHGEGGERRRGEAAGRSTSRRSGSVRLAWLSFWWFGEGEEGEV